MNAEQLMTDPNYAATYEYCERLWEDMAQFVERTPGVSEEVLMRCVSFFIGGWIAHKHQVYPAEQRFESLAHFQQWMAEGLHDTWEDLEEEKSVEK